MAYCVLAQVIAEFKDVNISVTTPVTVADVNRFIEEADACIDSSLSQRYTVPVTGAQSLIVVRNLSIMIVAQRIKDILKVKTGKEDANQDGRGNLRGLAEKKLKAIVDRAINLTDATEKSAGAGVKSYTSSNDVPHIFERGTDQW